MIWTVVDEPSTPRHRRLLEILFATGGEAYDEAIT
jgi:hypothetical protein